MEPITVFKSASCGCCVAWMKHLEANGFKATGKNLPSAALMQKKWEVGLKPEHSSCHTGQVAGYVLEGHVPARDIRRILSEGLARKNVVQGKSVSRRVERGW